MEKERSKADEISDRLLDFAGRVTKICSQLYRTEEGKYIASQLIRAATSVGANYEEARGAQSKADFVHKLQIVLKEARESRYWLRLIQRIDLARGDEVSALIDESGQIGNIIGRSVVTTKSPH